jgi:hypothetical protein
MSQAEKILRQCQQLGRQLEHALREAGIETDLSKLLPALRSTLSADSIAQADERVAAVQPAIPRGIAAEAMRRSLGDVPKHLHCHLRRV